MNKTFKIVFNRARQIFMVANEITSSVQKRGTKVGLLATVVAPLLFSGLALTLAPSAFAETKTIENETIDRVFVNICSAHPIAR